MHRKGGPSRGGGLRAPRGGTPGARRRPPPVGGGGGGDCGTLRPAPPPNRPPGGPPPPLCCPPPPVPEPSPPPQPGPRRLASRFFLAPLAVYTTLPFRLAIRELGGLGLATTDLVNARALLRTSRKTLELIQTCPEDRPVAVQIYGADPQEMA